MSFKLEEMRPTQIIPVGSDDKIVVVVTGEATPQAIEYFARELNSWWDSELKFFVVHVDANLDLKFERPNDSGE